MYGSFLHFVNFKWVCVLEIKRVRKWQFCLIEIKLENRFYNASPLEVREIQKLLKTTLGVESSNMSRVVGFFLKRRLGLITINDSYKQVMNGESIRRRVPYYMWGILVMSTSLKRYKQLWKISYRLKRLNVFFMTLTWEGKHSIPMAVT